MASLRVALFSLAVLATLGSGRVAHAEEAAPLGWCAPELARLGERACFHPAPARAAGSSGSSTNSEARTLVIFLHSLIGAADGAAWEQQRRLLRAADAYGFSALIPRGRPGLGPGRDPSVLGWPTALEHQEQYESELLEEWRGAREQAERLGGPFTRVLLFGFSNGAYYAESLAFREALPVDGVAIFAGGSGSKYQRILATRAKHRVPLFLGYGTEDPDRSRQIQLRDMLKQINWPHRALAARIGHTVGDAQLRAALAFLGHPLPSQADRGESL